jgi:hypothetical protein
MKYFSQSRKDEKAAKLYSVMYLFASFYFFLEALREKGWRNISRKVAKMKKSQSCIA